MNRRLRELESRESRMPEPPPEVAERVWRGVEMRVASGEPLELSEAPLIADVPAKAAVLKLVIGGALVVLGVVGVGVAGSRMREQAPAADPSVELEGEVVVPEVPPSKPIEPVRPTRPAVAIDPPPVVEEPPPVVTPKTKPKPVSEPASKPKTLADEVALIEAISKGLKASEWKSVLKLVAEHERDFANGNFVEERDAAKVRAQCRSGSLDAGREAAERFSERWPTSIHRATIRQDCDL